MNFFKKLLASKQQPLDLLRYESGDGEQEYVRLCHECAVQKIPFAPQLRFNIIEYYVPIFTVKRIFWYPVIMRALKIISHESLQSLVYDRHIEMPPFYETEINLNADNDNNNLWLFESVRGRLCLHVLIKESNILDVPEILAVISIVFCLLAADQQMETGEIVLTLAKLHLPESALSLLEISSRVPRLSPRLVFKKKPHLCDYTAEDLSLSDYDPYQ